MNHRIYLLIYKERIDEINYECSHSFVVIADKTNEARLYCSDFTYLHHTGNKEDWVDKSVTTCTLIGYSNRKKGIVLESNRGA